MGRYRYYSTERPLGPGCIPRPAAITEVVNFGSKTFCESIGREAYGYADFTERLTEEQVKAYELVPDGRRLWYRVTTTEKADGTVRACVTGCIEFDSAPANSYQRKGEKHIYTDWFKSHEEAECFAAETTPETL